MKISRKLSSSLTKVFTALLGFTLMIQLVLAPVLAAVQPGLPGTPGQPSAPNEASQSAVAGQPGEPQAQPKVIVPDQTVTTDPAQTTQSGPQNTTAQTNPSQNTSTPVSGTGNSNSSNNNQPSSGNGLMPDGSIWTPASPFLGSQGALNSNTGSNSTNQAATGATGATDVNNSNQSSAVGSTSIDATTGGNSGSSIIGAATIQTGTATAGVSTNNALDSSVTGGGISNSVSGSGANSSSQNLNTGNSSDNNASTNNSQTYILTNSNDLNSQQNGNVNTSSGNNSLQKVNGPATINSGNNNVNFDMVTLGNTNLVGTGGADLKLVNFDIYNTQVGNIDLGNANGVSLVPGSGMSGSQSSASNQSTGSNSTNSSQTASDNTQTLNNFNNANVSNNAQITADTGGNSTQNINGDSTITTGDANIAANIINFLNTTVTAAKNFVIGVVNIFGTLKGDILLPGSPGSVSADATSNSNSFQAVNNSTGVGSTNNATAEQNTQTGLTNINNALIGNQIDINANTGGNNASSINGDTAINTGTINAQGQIVNSGNTSSIGGNSSPNFWLVIINKLGQWTGQILGTDSQGQTVASSNVFQISSQDLSALNQNTGNGSQNNSTLSSNLQSDTTNVNNAQVNNNLTINASTGGNSFRKNNGNNTLTTGNVNILANVANFFNRNFVGQNWGLAIVNVFGNWIGNVITPDYKAPAQQVAAVNLPKDSKPGLPSNTNVGTTGALSDNGIAGQSQISPVLPQTETSHPQADPKITVSDVSVPVKYNIPPTAILGNSTYFVSPKSQVKEQSNVVTATSEDTQPKITVYTVSQAKPTGSKSSQPSWLKFLADLFNNPKLAGPFGIGGSLLTIGAVGSFTKKKLS